MALILAVLVFLTGISLGSFINQERAENLQKDTEISKLDFDSLQVQYLFLNSIIEKEKNCIAAATALDENIKSLEILGSKLTTYMSEQLITQEEDFETLKREYTLAEFRYWLFAKKFKESCNADNVLILYFYSNKDCEYCSTQGVILSYLKGYFKDKLLNFALDIDFNKEPMIRIVKNTYNVTKTPTLVINEKKYEGFYSKEELLHIICGLYKTEIPECEGVEKK